MASDDLDLPDLNPSPAVEARMPVWRRLAALIATHNPFYLISVSFVLHGTAHWFRNDGTPMASPWPLIGLVGGYIISLAIVGWVIVRFGKQWDDARSLLLIIPLLFVELSLLFDETLLRDPATGRLLLVVGLAGAIVVSEALIRGLDIRLGWGYRLPYHLLLTLLFLYPVSLASLTVIRDPAAYSWRIFLFSTFTAGIALMLWPAVRRGSELVRNNGTPWPWPWYPWSLFIMLFVCVGFRAYALSLSFDPVLSLDPAAADRLENAFGTYYLVPFVLACGVLILEGGIASRSLRTQRWALLIPILATVLAIPAAQAPAPYSEFLRRFMDQLASPLWLTLLASGAFYGWAWCRKIALAEFGVLTALVLMTVVHSETTNLQTLQQPVAWPIGAIAMIELVLAHRIGRSARALFGAMAFAAGMYFIPLKLEPQTIRIAISSMTVLVSLLWIGLHFQDRLAVICRRVGALLLVVLTIAGNVGNAIVSENADSVSMLPMTFTVAMIGMAWWYASIVKMPDYVIAGLCNLGVGATAMAWHLINWLRRISAWQGITSFLLGLLWLLIAVLISSWKAGWLQTGLRRLNRFIEIDRT